MPDARLEIREVDGAFARIEAWLAEHGFFSPGGDDLVADVYLGYGLSQSIRRSNVRLLRSRVPRSRLPHADCGTEP